MAVGNIIVLIVAGASTIEKQVSMQAIDVLLYYTVRKLLGVLCNELKWLCQRGKSLCLQQLWQSPVSGKLNQKEQETKMLRLFR